MLIAARQEIDEVEGIIKGHGMIKDCVDVGIIDAYWLLAWIKLFEVWDDENQLREAASDILQLILLLLHAHDLCTTPTYTL